MRINTIQSKNRLEGDRKLIVFSLNAFMFTMSQNIVQAMKPRQLQTNQGVQINLILAVSLLSHGLGSTRGILKNMSLEIRRVQSMRRLCAIFGLLRA